MSVKLMCVTAHPDDECFAFGGALALAGERGVETYVVCLTDGKAATSRGVAASDGALGKVRSEEFAASCKVLGVMHYEVLDYEDGRLVCVNFGEVAGRLVKRMRRFMPDVVLTFGCDGGLNAHSDHMMACALTSAAFHWSGRAKLYTEIGSIFQPQRLYYASTNSFLPGRQEPLPAPWTVKVDIRSVQQRKAEAFQEHASQRPVMDSSKEFFEAHGSEEFYTLAASAGAQPMRFMNDLFEGIEVEDLHPEGIKAERSNGERSNGGSR